MFSQNTGLTVRFLVPILVGLVVLFGIGSSAIFSSIQQAMVAQFELASATLHSEQERNMKRMSDALEVKVKRFGTFMAGIAPDMILAYDYDGLKSQMSQANSDADIAYSGFLDAGGQPLIKFSTAVQDVVEQRFSIVSDGERIGTLVLGQSMVSVRRAEAESKERILETVDKVSQQMDSELDLFVRMMVIASMALVALVGVVMSLMFRRLILNPLQQTGRLLQQLSNGSGDLTFKLPIQYEDEIGQLRIYVNDFVSYLHETVHAISSEVDGLSTQASDLASLGSEMQHNSMDQLGEITQVAAAMNQMSSSAQEVSSHANEAASAAQSTDGDAVTGHRVVSETIQSIQTLSQKVAQAAEVIQQLEREGENIGSVLDVIRGIAEQTNLLALNAAIEAARAGEHGRGFAVVADEVRTLASRTQQSTQEIQQMIERIQSGTRNAVTAMQESKTRSESSVDEARLAGSSLAAITSAVARIVDMNTMIASAATEQTSVAEEINRNINNISGVAQENSVTADRTARASGDLQQMASKLAGIVGRFKL